MSTTEIKYLTPMEAADRMRVSRSLVYALVEEGRIKAIRIGQKGRRGKLLVSEAEVERFLEECSSE